MSNDGAIVETGKSSDFRLTFNTDRSDGGKPDLDQQSAARLLLDEATSKTPSMAPDNSTKHLRALIVVTSDSDFGELTKLNGRQTGAFLAEAAKPIAAAVKGGIDVDVASPKGGAVPLDPVGLRPDFLSHLNISQGEAALGIAMLSHTKSLSDVEADAAKYDVVFIAGGHGASFDLPSNQSLQNIVRTVYESGHVVAAICHGVEGLKNVHESNGALLVSGKNMTTFSEAEEQHEGLTQFMPPHSGIHGLIENGAVVSTNPAILHPYAVRDGNLVTGENPLSGDATILKVREALSDSLKH